MAKTQKPGNQGGGYHSRNSIKKKAAAAAIDAITVLVSIMKDPKAQDSSRVSAAKTILNKALPDLKSTEWKSEDGDQLRGLIIVKSDANKVK